jgi:Fe-S-cluster containining protein
MIENPEKFFQDPKRLPDKTTEKVLGEGVYFSVSGGQYKVVIIGNCPNLKNRDCGIYPNHPSGCKKIEINSISCQQARERDSKINENII